MHWRSTVLWHTKRRCNEKKKEEEEKEEEEEEKKKKETKKQRNTKIGCCNSPVTHKENVLM